MDRLDCRSEVGITVGLIDSLIYISRVLNNRDLDHPAIKEAFKDLQASEISKIIEENFDTHRITDGYYTFKELYNYRMVYNAILFNEWAAHLTTGEGFGQALFNVPKYDVHKSKRHYTGELCFDGNYFIVCAELPTGQISNHYHIDHWDLFKVPVTEKAKYKWDGHTPEDTFNRMKQHILNYD